VEKGSEDNDNFGIFNRQIVIDDKTWLNAPIQKKPEQLQSDVRDDLHVNGSVIAHPKPLDSIEIGNLPKGVELIIPIHPLDDLLQLGIMPGGQSNNNSLGWFQDFRTHHFRGLQTFIALGSLNLNISNFLAFHVSMQCTSFKDTQA
jgi:hypothetical protein